MTSEPLRHFVSLHEYRRPERQSEGLIRDRFYRLKILFEPPAESQSVFQSVDELVQFSPSKVKRLVPDPDLSEQRKELEKLLGEVTSDPGKSVNVFLSPPFGQVGSLLEPLIEKFGGTRIPSPDRNQPFDENWRGEMENLSGKLFFIIGLEDYFLNYPLGLI